MGLNVVGNWFQIAAGGFAIYGMLFLATGITDEKSNLKFTGPLLGSIGTLAWFLLEGYLFHWFSGQDFGYIHIAIVLGILVLGYFFGWSWMQRFNRSFINTDDPARPREGIRSPTNSVALMGAGSAVFVPYILFCAWAYFDSPQISTISTTGILLICLELSLVIGFNIACLRGAVEASAKALRLIGLGFGVLSAILLLVPPIINTLGTPIK